MSVTFSTGFHQIKPGLRISGDEISAAIIGTYDSGIYAGKKYIHIDLTNEIDMTLVEEGVAGPLETVPDVDALYAQLKAAGMNEAFDGFLFDASDLSIIKIDSETISFDFAGHEPYIFDRNPDPAATERTKLAHQTWLIPQPDFTAANGLFTALEGSEELELVSIENRLGLLEATNGLIKEDFNFITLVGTPSPEPGQVGVNNTVPSQIEMIVLPSTDSDGKALNYSDFKLGDRMGLKQANGSAAIYSLEPTLDMGTHFRFNVELLTLGYYGDQEFAFDTAVTAIIEDTSARTSAAAVMGVGVGDTNLGTFTGTTLADGTTAKEALQSLESGLEATISSLASEATTREADDAALDGRVSALEADPTTAAAVAAGDAATLSSANTYTDTSITNLVNGADAALDTLKEIGDALAQGDTDVTAALTAQITTESTARSTADAALSGRLDVLEADPTTATAVTTGDSTTLASANTYTDGEVASEATTRSTADTALSDRLDVLEADPTTQSAVDAEVTARTTADSALDGRVTTLEGNAAITDPTTATAVAAVQSDVDANETASDAADAALSGRLDVLEADPTTQAAVDLKANKAGDTFTGDVIIDEGTGSTIKLETTDATSAGIHIEGPSGSMGYLDTTNGFGNDSLQVYSANFWLRAINGGTGNLIVDGSVTLNGASLSVASLPGPYTNDGDAATAGIPVGSLYYDGNGHVRFRVS